MVRQPGADLRSMASLIAMAGSWYFLAALFQFGSDKLSFYVATQVEDRWRYAGLHRYYNLPMAWQDQHDSGEIGAKMEQGAVSMFSIIYEIFGQNLIVSFVTLVCVVAYTSWHYPLFGLILVGPIPLYLLVTYFISRHIAAMQERVNSLYHIAARTWYDGVGNMRYVKAFGRETAETEHYASKWDAFHSLEYATERWWLTQSFIQKAIESVVRIAVLAYALSCVFAGRLSIGEVVMLMTFQQLTFAPLELMHRLFTRLRRVVKRAAHIFEVVAEPDPLADRQAARELKKLKQGIVVEGLRFRYGKKSSHALKGLSFEVKAGTTTAVVGRSGAGKSTLAMLLLRFYDPDAGRILWDGLDLREASKASLRSRTTMILQDTTLFNRSITDNIRYGRPRAGKREIVAAAKLAHAHGFILALPQGYDSVVGERGVRLSGGQRQRIAIARALLVNPELLVMDEATSHLDSETEAAIQEAIAYLHGKHTQVIIAHRLSTVMHADQILLMDKGAIVARGRHRELMKDPLYRRLCRNQFMT